MSVCCSYACNAGFDSFRALVEANEDLVQTCNLGSTFMLLPAPLMRLRVLLSARLAPGQAPLPVRRETARMAAHTCMWLMCVCTLTCACRHMHASGTSRGAGTCSMTLWACLGFSAFLAFLLVVLRSVLLATSSSSLAYSPLCPECLPVLPSGGPGLMRCSLHPCPPACWIQLHHCSLRRPPKTTRPCCTLRFFLGG